jgi:quercetin dioxygenase-like cupin family protein
MGSRFWVVQMPAGMGGDEASIERTRQAVETQGGIPASSAGAMHATRTLDYVIVLDGEITLVVDDGEVTLHKYDVCIQRGTAHTWGNRTSEPALLAFVLLDAEPLA